MRRRTRSSSIHIQRPHPRHRVAAPSRPSGKMSTAMAHAQQEQHQEQYEGEEVQGGPQPLEALMASLRADEVAAGGGSPAGPAS